MIIMHIESSIIHLRRFYFPSSHLSQISSTVASCIEQCIGADTMKFHYTFMGHDQRGER